MVSWGYKNTNGVQAEVVNRNELLEGNEKFTTLNHLTSEIVYSNAYNNVDLQYITTTVGIKENLILKNSRSQSEFEIQYKIDSLTAKQIDDKRIDLYDKSNNIIYTIAAPYMIDAGGKISTQLSLKILQQKDNELIVKLSADKDFLMDCKYPAVIDPAFMTSKRALR